MVTALLSSERNIEAMKLSVLANLYGAKSLDETLSILTSLGVHTVEIGAGGYPGKAHCNPAELLADERS